MHFNFLGHLKSLLASLTHAQTLFTRPQHAYCNINHAPPQPYSQLICRPYTVCFSWHAGVRESSVSEWRWNTGQFNSSLRSDYSAPNMPCINSGLICWHTVGCPEIPPKLFPRDLAPATPMSTSLPHLSNSHQNPKVPGFVWMGSLLAILFSAGDRDDIIVLR